MGKVIQRSSKRVSATRKHVATARRTATGKAASSKIASAKTARRWVSKNYAKLQRLAVGGAKHARAYRPRAILTWACNHSRSPRPASQGVRPCHPARRHLLAAGLSATG